MQNSVWIPPVLGGTVNMPSNPAHALLDVIVDSNVGGLLRSKFNLCTVFGEYRVVTTISAWVFYRFNRGMKGGIVAIFLKNGTFSKGAVQGAQMVVARGGLVGRGCFFWRCSG